MVEIDIHDDDAGQRVDRYLRKLLRAAPLALIHRLLRQGSVRCEGRRLGPADRLEPGARLLLDLDHARLAELRGAGATPRTRAARGLRVPVVFEDDVLLAVDKPGGMAVQPGTGHEHDDLTAWLAGHLQVRAHSTFQPAPAHRIDLGTSGLVLIGKTAAAARTLAQAFREHRVRKTYLAVVEGQPQPAQGTLDMALRVQDRGVARERTTPDDEGLRAVTRYRTLRSADGVSLLEVEIDTGHTHQIRAHLAAIGHPLLNDRRYGARADRRLPHARIALHATRLVLDHPGSGEPLTLAAPLPAELRALCAPPRRGRDDSA